MICEFLADIGHFCQDIGVPWGPQKAMKKLVIVLVPTQKLWDNFDPSIIGQDPGLRVQHQNSWCSYSGDLPVTETTESAGFDQLQMVDGWLRCFPYPLLIKAGNEINNSSKKKFDDVLFFAHVQWISQP